MSKCTILGDNTTCDCSEACNSTRPRLMQLQASEPVIHGIITQIAHLTICYLLYIIITCWYRVSFTCTCMLKYYDSVKQFVMVTTLTDLHVIASANIIGAHGTFTCMVDALHA